MTADFIIIRDYLYLQRNAEIRFLWPDTLVFLSESHMVEQKPNDFELNLKYDKIFRRKRQWYFQEVLGKKI